MELRNENTERKRNRKLASRGPVLVRSVKTGSALSASFDNEKKAPTGFWKRA
jgi:hypothetical protein